MKEQAKQPAGREIEFPKLSLKLSQSSSDSALINFYQNGMMYINDDKINGKTNNYEVISKMIREDERLDDNAKIFLLSSIQLSNEVLTTQEAIEFYDKNRTNGQLSTRDVCDCSSTYNAYAQARLQCQAYQGMWGHCQGTQDLLNLYESCIKKKNNCPNGFVFDGANCYSGVHFDSKKYKGFIWGNGFYTQRNCKVSTANNCCPPGFGFDGANCHYWGKYFPSDFEPFIWNNTFYVRSKCF
jgi:hypothetical protein